MCLLLSGSRFVSWLRLRRCVTFWVETDSFADWVCGDALPYELIQFRLLIEYVGMRSLLSRSRFVCWLSMWGCVSFWVEANTFADWVCGDAFPFKFIQFRLLIEYVGMRYLLIRSKYVYCLRLRNCVTFWVDTVSFADWVCGNAFPFEEKQIRLLIECVGMRSLLSWYSFVY